MSERRGFFAGSTFQDKPRERMLPQCGACKLHLRCKSPKLVPQGQGAAKVLLVGEAPIEEDDDVAQLWQGKQGRRLRNVLGALKVDVDRDCWSTNSLACATPKDRAPTAAEVLHCRPNMTKAIKELQPQVIVPMGQQAIASVLGPIWKEDVGPAARWTGWQIPSNDLNAWICPTWGLKEILKRDDEIYDKQFANHLADAFALPGVPHPAGPRDWAADVEIVYDPAKAARWLRKAAQQRQGAVAWDYEATALKPEGPFAKIVSCAVTWGRDKPERTIAYPWAGKAITATQELLRSPIPKIASNLKFEDRWTRIEFGHRVRAWAWDTMLAAHCLDNRPWITSVKFQAFIRLGVPVWNKHVEPYLKSKGDAKTNRILEEVELKDLLLYNGLDALLEWAVAWDQIQEMNYPVPWDTGR